MESLPDKHGVVAQEQLSACMERFQLVQLASDESSLQAVISSCSSCSRSWEEYQINSETLVSRLQAVCAEELCQAVQLASDKIYDASSETIILDFQCTIHGGVIARTLQATRKSEPAAHALSPRG